MGLKPGFQAGQSQGEIKLVVGAVAHPFDAHQPAVGPDSLDHRMAVAVVVDLEPVERSAGEQAEQGAGARQDRSLVLFAITFDAPVQDRRGQLQGGIPRNVPLQLGEECLGFLGALGGTVAAVHPRQFTTLGADGLVQAAQLLFQGRDLGLVLLDRGVERVVIGLFDFGGERGDLGARGANDQLLLAGGEVRFEAGAVLRAALGFGELVELGAIRLRTEPLQADAGLLAMSLGREEVPFFTLSLLGQRVAFLVVGLGVSEAAGQLAGLVAGRSIGQVRGDSRRQRRDVRRELVGVAVDPTDAALVVASIVQLFQEFADLGQEDLGLLGAAPASRPMRAIFADHSVCQASSADSADWSESWAVLRSVRAAASLVSSFDRF